MSPSRSLLASIPILALTLIIASCEDNGVEVIEGGPGIIVPGKSVEGIKLGDSRETVEAKLGKAQSGGIADGFYRAWYVADYLEGTHAGLSVYYVEINNLPGPVDMLIVLSPYAGKTKEGIGIGSPINKVHQVYASPEHTLYSPSNNWIVDFYCINEHMLQIQYTDSLVISCCIGYFVPLPQDSLSCSR
jgi:hypothetical protein